MSITSRQRSDEFLRIAGQFKLGGLVTESSHPMTAELSDVAAEDTSAALDLLFQVDLDVVRKYREWVESDAPRGIGDEVIRRLRSGGRVFFTGCGATGRLSLLLDAIWRGFWQQREDPHSWRDRTTGIMAGGDFALIKSVEGFEDITAFGRRQIAECGVGEGDVVFAITEGGETSWVIGTAWEALDRGAKVYFVYNNPDDVLWEHVQRSREVIDEPRIEKINLTTGPMAITGSTRMQATSIQLCVMMTVLEIVARDLVGTSSADAPRRFLQDLEEMHSRLREKTTLAQTAELLEMEEAVYRDGGKTNYFAGSLALDVLTDTTERSPTFCTPSFKRFDDTAASDSWVYLFTGADDSESAWRRMLRRGPRAVEWTREQVAELVRADEVDQRFAVVKRISLADIHKFKIGFEGIDYRRPRPGDAALAIVSDGDADLLAYLRSAEAAGAKTGVISFCDLCGQVSLPIEKGEWLLEGIRHVAAKMLLNALSTCIMVRLGRVMGNYMIYVVPSNLKLIDRATRYISRLTDLPYDEANRLLFEVIEYVEPRMKSDQAYPPVVGMAVLRARHGLTNEQAEARLASGYLS